MSFSIVNDQALVGELRFANVFADRLVLQRDKPVPSWGWADRSIEAAVAFAGWSKTVRADVSGRWRVELGPMMASFENRELTATAGAATAHLESVLVGEVRSELVHQLVAVRYLWAHQPDANARGRRGIPVSVFLTGD